MEGWVKMSEINEPGEVQDVTETSEVTETPETASEIDDDISSKYDEYLENGKAQDFEHKSAIEKETAREESHLNCPRENGHWEDGEESRGESKWIPDRNYIPPDNGKGNNPEGKSMGEIMDEHDIDGITYKDGEPDFSEVRHGEPVQIEEFSDNRAKNFNKADIEYSERHNKENPDDPMTPGDVKAYRQENQLTWHEQRDCSTMEMVPREIHGNFSHRGGVSESKNRSEL